MATIHVVAAITTDGERHVPASGWSAIHWRCSLMHPLNARVVEGGLSKLRKTDPALTMVTRIMWKCPPPLLLLLFYVLYTIVSWYIHISVYILYTIYTYVRQAGGIVFFLNIAPLIRFDNWRCALGLIFHPALCKLVQYLSFLWIYWWWQLDLGDTGASTIFFQIIVYRKKIFSQKNKFQTTNLNSQFQISVFSYKIKKLKDKVSVYKI